MEHLADSDVEGFLKGELPPEDSRRVVRHLVSGCQPCTARVAAAGLPKLCLPLQPPPEEDAYDAAIDRALKKARQATRRWKDDQERLERGIGWVRERHGTFSGLTGPQMQSILPWIHVEILLQVSFELRYSNPGHMLELAESAQRIVERIEKTPYGNGFLSDLRARTWADLGNAYRVNEIYRKADACFQHARLILEQGTGDLLLMARIDDLEASLRKDQRRFDEACTRHDEAYQAYRKLGERHLSGRALVGKGITLALARQPRKAAHTFRRALPLLDASRDPQLITSTQHNFLDSLVDSGDLHGAVRILVQTDLREKLANDPLNRVRLRWVEAKIFAGQKRFEEAERIFEEVRKSFYEQKLPYVASVAGIDHVILLLDQGKHKEAYQLAYHLKLVFYNHEGNEEAYKALVFLEHLCQKRLATQGMAEAVRSFLERSQQDRSLRFDLLGVLRRGLDETRGI